MSDTALLPCPFCGSRNVAQGASRDRISVWCVCGAQGPSVDFPEDCIDPVTPIKECHGLWNRRSRASATLTELDERALQAAVDAASQHLEVDGDNEGSFIRFDSVEAGVRAAVRAYLSALPASEAGWRPIETVPEDDALFLAYCPPDVDFPDGRMMIWKGSIFAYQKKPTPSHLQFPATHWMPLPAAPDRRAGE